MRSWPQIKGWVKGQTMTDTDTEFLMFPWNDVTIISFFTDTDLSRLSAEKKKKKRIKAK